MARIVRVPIRLMRRAGRWAAAPPPRALAAGGFAVAVGLFIVAVMVRRWSSLNDDAAMVVQFLSVLALSGLLGAAILLPIRFSRARGVLHACAWTSFLASGLLSILRDG